MEPRNCKSHPTPPEKSTQLAIPSNGAMQTPYPSGSIGEGCGEDEGGETALDKTFASRRERGRQEVTSGAWANLTYMRLCQRWSNRNIAASLNAKMVVFDCGKAPAVADSPP